MLSKTFLLTGLLLLPAWSLAMMDDDPTVSMIRFNEFEVRDNESSALDGDFWIGRDLRKFWVKGEVERHDGDIESSELQFLFSRAIAPNWDVQVGIRQEFDPSPDRTWFAFGVQGLAPYYFESDMTLFVGESGRTALRLSFEKELMLTQRWVLSPEIEVGLFGKDDAARGVGRGLSSAEVGVRLRYEFRREIAPYIGVHRERSFGRTADFSGDDSRTTFVVGLRWWH